MKQTIHPIAQKHNRSGSFKGYALSGWDYEEGWLVSFCLAGTNPITTVWVDGSFESPCFRSIPPFQHDGQRVVEIDPTPTDLAPEEKDAILSTIWEWDVWEPVTIAGTCMIDSLVRALGLPRDSVLDWFRITRRDPSIQEEVVKTLEENGYTVNVAGPEGFGEFYDCRRLVFMFRKDDPREGHVVLVYEEDKDIFDSAGVFKKVSDILFTGTLGYDRGPVLTIEKDGQQI